jgi:hypothetical protein
VQSDLFPPKEAVHPNWAGASLNARIVVEAIKSLKECDLKDYLRENPQVPETPDITPQQHGEPGPSERLPERAE